jgi:hypothetical protein
VLPCCHAFANREAQLRELDTRRSGLSTRAFDDIPVGSSWTSAAITKYGLSEPARGPRPKVLRAVRRDEGVVTAR